MILPSPRDLLPLLSGEGRLMGLDAGEATIGVSISDVRRTIASPVTTIERKKFSKDAEALSKLCKEYNPAALIIGYPINMDGSEGPRCQSTRQLARNLAEKGFPPVLLWDERMSTMAVARTLEESGMSHTKRDTLVDKMAAAYILQGVLDWLEKNPT